MHSVPNSRSLDKRVIRRCLNFVFFFLPGVSLSCKVCVFVNYAKNCRHMIEVFTELSVSFTQKIFFYLFLFNQHVLNFLSEAFIIIN